MAGSLIHRGPDDSGVHVSGAAGLAFRRLSIIDLAGGHQPLFNESGDLALVLNGEIYNYIELQAELRERGHRFSTRSDAEVVLHLYEDEGERCIEKLRGMFSFALFDSRVGRVMVARDRIGIKPLYYAALPDGLRFGSEIKALLADSSVPTELDPVFLDDYLSFGYGLHPHTAYRRIRILPAAHYLVAEARDPTSTRVIRYWEPPTAPDQVPGEEEWVSLLRETLGQSVELHMRSDVPYGAFLSGGLDSSTIVALMAQRMDEPVRTFSIGFPEQGVSELPYARQIANRWQTLHRERVVEPADIETVERLIHHFDEPYADSSALPTYFVSQLAREDVKVILSGDGGDELFGGYNKYTRTLALARWDQVPERLRRLAFEPLERIWPRSVPGKGYLKRLAVGANERFLQDGLFFSEREKEAMLRPEVLSRIRGARHESNAFLRFLDSRNDLEGLSRYSLGDLTYYLVDDILQKVDRCSMAHSLEVRVPVLDHEVVELARRMPSRYKIRNGTKKYIMRKAFGELLTPDVLDHRKQGFFAPVNQWFRGDLGSYARDVLLSDGRATEDLIDRSFIEGLLRDHQRGLRNLGERIWALLILEKWAQGKNRW